MAPIRSRIARYASLAWAMAAWSDTAVASSLEECRAVVAQKYISRCVVSLGHCDSAGCETLARCDKGNRRCEQLLSGGNYLAAKTGTRYCSSTAANYTGGTREEVAQEMCPAERTDAERSAWLERLRTIDDSQTRTDLALAEDLLKVAEVFSQPDPRRSRPSAPFVKPGRADHLERVCSRLAQRRLQRINAELGASLSRREQPSAALFAEELQLKSAKIHLCACVQQKAEKNFSDAEIAETITNNSLWGQLPKQRLAEVFDECAARAFGRGKGLETIPWLFTLPER